MERDKIVELNTKKLSRHQESIMKKKSEKSIKQKIATYSFSRKFNIAKYMSSLLNSDIQQESSSSKSEANAVTSTPLKHQADDNDSKELHTTTTTTSSTTFIEKGFTEMTTEKQISNVTPVCEYCKCNKHQHQHSETEKQTESTDIMTAYGNIIIEQQPGTMMSNISQSGGVERKEHLYKILVIGELGTGKTSIIKRYVHQFFSQHYRATIGVDFALKVLNWDENTIIRLQLWDIAGQERFGNMTRVYYKDAVGAFIVFDVTRVATFDAVDKWKQDLDSKIQLSDGSSIPCVLLGNKCDQQKEGIVNIPMRMDEYCKEKGFAGWFETSAKENIHIEEAARFLVNQILLNDKLLHNNETNRDHDRIAIDQRDDGRHRHHQNVSKTCSC